MKKLIIFSVAGTMLLLPLAKEAGVRVNLTDSAPYGVWIVHPVTIDLLLDGRGRLVSACPPDVPVVKMMGDRGLIPPGDCPKTQTIPMLKAIGAVPGDTVIIRAGKPAIINGEEIPNTIAKHQAYAWPDGEYVVKPNQVWVFSTYTINSFDSRYFGPVKTSNILGEAFPVMIDGKHDNMRRGLNHD